MSHISKVCTVSTDCSVCTVSTDCTVSTASTKYTDHMKAMDLRHLGQMKRGIRKIKYWCPNVNEFREAPENEMQL